MVEFKDGLNLTKKVYIEVVKKAILDLKIAISLKMTIWVILEWPFNLGPFLNISQCESFLKNDNRFLVYREPFDRNLKVLYVVLSVKFKYEFQKVLAPLCKRVPPYTE